MVTKVEPCTSKKETEEKYEREFDKSQDYEPEKTIQNSNNKNIEGRLSTKKNDDKDIYNPFIYESN